MSTCRNSRRRSLLFFEFKNYCFFYANDTSCLQKAFILVDGKGDTIHLGAPCSSCAECFHIWCGTCPGPGPMRIAAEIDAFTIVACAPYSYRLPYTVSTNFGFVNVSNRAGIPEWSNVLVRSSAIFAAGSAMAGGADRVRRLVLVGGSSRARSPRVQ